MYSLLHWNVCCFQGTCIESVSYHASIKLEIPQTEEECGAYGISLTML